MSLQPKRFLNETSFFLGLEYSDTIYLASIFIILHKVSEYFGTKILGTILIILITLSLITIRLKYRKGVILETMKFFLRGKFINAKVRSRLLSKE